MNALKTGFFGQASLAEIEHDPYYQEILQGLLPQINAKNSEQLSVAKEISFWRLKEKQLREAMEFYRKKWRYRQFTAKDMAQKATEGKAPILDKPELADLYYMQDFPQDVRDGIVEKQREDAQITYTKMQEMRTRYGEIIHKFLHNKDEDNLSYTNKKEINMFYRVTRQALNMMEINYSFHQNQWVYALYRDEIIAYLKAMPKTPDTGHWRNMLSEKNKIQQKIEELSQQLTLNQGESDDKSTKNSFSDTQTPQAISGDIKRALSTTNQKMMHFKDNNKKNKKKKRIRLK